MENVKSKCCRGVGGQSKKSGMFLRCSASDALQRVVGDG